MTVGLWYGFMKVRDQAIRCAGASAKCEHPERRPPIRQPTAFINF